MDTALHGGSSERPPRWGWVVAALVAGVIVGFAVFVLVPTWGDGWLAKARVEILGAPLFADPPPGWTQDFHSAGGSLGERESIVVSWTAPGTVAEAVKALHDRYGDRYIIRRANNPENQRLVLESWTRPGSELPILVSFSTTLTPNQTGVHATVDAPRELLKDPRNRP